MLRIEVFLNRSVCIHCTLRKDQDVNIEKDYFVRTSFLIQLRPIVNFNCKGRNLDPKHRRDEENNFMSVATVRG